MQPPAPPALGPDDANVMNQISRAHLDMIKMAFACDLTRVASIQYSNGANHHTFPFIGSTKSRERSTVPPERSTWSPGQPEDAP